MIPSHSEWWSAIHKMTGHEWKFHWQEHERHHRREHEVSWTEKTWCCFVVLGECNRAVKKEKGGRKTRHFCKRNPQSSPVQAEWLSNKNGFCFRSINWWNSLFSCCWMESLADVTVSFRWSERPFQQGQARQNCALVSTENWCWWFLLDVL